MSQFGLRASCVCLLSWSLSGMALADPVATMGGVGQAIASCWDAPTGAGSSAVTLRFSFKRDGSLLGEPRPTAVDIKGDGDAKQRFIAAAIDAVERCTPIALSPTLAEGIGGRVFTMRFSSPDYQVGRQIASPQ